MNLIVRIEDLVDERGGRYCNRGAREWLRRHGFDWSEFRAHGLPAEVLLATGDAMAAQAVRRAEQRTGAS